VDLSDGTVLAEAGWSGCGHTLRRKFMPVPGSDQNLGSFARLIAQGRGGAIQTNHLNSHPAKKTSIDQDDMHARRLDPVGVADLFLSMITKAQEDPALNEYPWTCMGDTGGRIAAPTQGFTHAGGDRKTARRGLLAQPPIGRSSELANEASISYTAIRGHKCTLSKHMHPRSDVAWLWSSEAALRGCASLYETQLSH
jgi:hypothetical protein